MEEVHWLTAGALRQCTVVCGARLPERGTWHRPLVTCPRCLAPARRRIQGTGDCSRERELQELVRQACGVGGWLYYHTHRSQHSPAGFPDTIAIRGERLVAAELKREGQEPTPAQRQWLEAFEWVRAIETYVWHPEDLPTILKVLR
jgi:hypothetical protein